MARKARKSGVKHVPPSEIGDNLSQAVRAAQARVIRITRRGKPAGLLIGFKDESRFDRTLENDPRFLRRVERARSTLRAGRGVKLKDA